MAEKKEEKKSKTKEPSKPQDTGVKISTARVRKVITDSHLNYELLPVVEELRAIVKNLESMKKIADKSGDSEDRKKYEKELENFKLSRRAQVMLKEVHEDLEAEAKRKFASTKLKGLRKNEEEYKKFSERKSELINESHRNPASKFYVRSIEEELDMHAIYTEIDESFFKDFKYEKKKLTPAELLSEVSKRKVRFSQSAGVAVGAFFEYFVSEIGINGMFNCIHNGRKQVKLDDAIDVSLEGARGRFDMFPMVECTEVYKRYTVDGRFSSQSKKNENNQFRTYVSKVFADLQKNVPATLGKNRINKSIREQFSSCSISRDLRDFVSELVVENLKKLADMCQVQLRHDDSKTISLKMMRTLFTQLAIHCRFNYKNLHSFIDSTMKNHVAYVAERLEFSRAQKIKKDKGEKPKKEKSKDEDSEKPKKKEKSKDKEKRESDEQEKPKKKKKKDDDDEE